MRAADDRRRSSVVAFDAPEWTPPPAVVLDTNVVAEALLFDEPENMACDTMLRRLAERETIVVFNRLLEIELWEVIFNHALRRDAPRSQWRHRRFTVAGRHHAAAALARAKEQWDDVLTTLDWHRVEPREVASAVPDLMRSYGLQSYDAVHAATLLATGLSDLVTRDAGFSTLLPEDATLHTTRARLARMRAGRRRRGSG